MSHPQQSELWSRKWHKTIDKLSAGDLVISPGGQIFFLCKKKVDEDDPFGGDVFYFNNPGNKGLHKKDYWGVVYTLQDTGYVVKRKIKYDF